MYESMEWFLKSWMHGIVATDWRLASSLGFGARSLFFAIADVEEVKESRIVWHLLILVILVGRKNHLFL